MRRGSGAAFVCWQGLFLVSVLAAVSSGARQFEVAAGRQLLDITTSVFGSSANFTLEVLAPKGSPNANAPCIFKGYPESKDNIPVQGPLIVEVPLGGTANISFAPLKNSAIVAIYNQTANNTLITYYNSSYGLISAALIANGSTTVGSSAYLTGGRVDNYPTNSWTSPTCLVNITFVVVPQPPPPPPPSPPPPSGTPGLGDYLNNLLGSLPKNPCYCTTVVNGKTSCFNFVAAGSDINCAPPSSYACEILQAAAGQFTSTTGPVFQCNTTDGSLLSLG